MKTTLFSGLILLLLTSLSAQERIVSLNGNISEMLCALGLESQIVGVDITSTYPASLQTKPKLGHNRNISAEGVLSLQPTLVLGLSEQFNPSLTDQLKAVKVKTMIFKQELSVQGVRNLLDEVARVTGTTGKATLLLHEFDRQMTALSVATSGKKVLFIYARGAGTLMVSGTGTSIDKMIQLAGGTNAVTDFTDFKPLAAESLVAANPDLILLFDSGLRSVGGIDGLLKIPGIAQTNAGRDKKIIAMDGELLSGFGLRLPQAIRELQDKIK